MLSFSIWTEKDCCQHSSAHLKHGATIFFIKMHKTTEIGACFAEPPMLTAKNKCATVVQQRASSDPSSPDSFVAFLVCFRRRKMKSERVS